jgi:hypothetical protein
MKNSGMIRRLRWVMLFVILFDFANTLLGQPSTFWQHPETMNEHNHLLHSLAARNLWYVIILMMLYAVGTFLFVSLARKWLALAGLFTVILNNFYGSSTWIDRHWGFGIAGVSIYSILLAAAIVLVGFPNKEKADA